MAVLLRRQKNNNASSTTYGKYYYKTYSLATVDLEGLADHMANHNSPYSKGCIAGVLRDMTACIKELLLDGKKVKIDDLCLFSLGIKSGGETNIEDMTVSSLVKHLYINAQGTGSLTTKNNLLLKQTSFKVFDSMSGSSEDSSEESTTGN